MKVQATIDQSKEKKKEKKSSPLAKGVISNKRSASWSMSVSLGKTAQKLILLNIKREAGSIVGNDMLLYTTSVAIEEHGIHLFLIVCFQIFILSNKPYSEIL